jgi:hypothetical protein
VFVLRNVYRVDQTDDPIIPEAAQLIDKGKRQSCLTEADHEELQWSVDDIGRHLDHL